jgi:hypothetical protein
MRRRAAVSGGCDPTQGTTGRRKSLTDDVQVIVLGARAPRLAFPLNSLCAVTVEPRIGHPWTPDRQVKRPRVQPASPFK